MLAVLIVVGVVVVMTLTVLVSGAQPASVDEASARATFALDRPGQTVDHVLVSTDHRAAIVIADGKREVVFAIGACLAMRPLRAVRRQGAAWRLDFGDFGAPSLTAEFPEATAEVLLA